MARSTTVLTGQLLDDSRQLTLAELCQACALHAETVIAMVEAGVLEPHDHGAARWRFGATNVRRLQTALRLQRDLGVNLAGVALALEMLDELNTLRARLALFDQRPEH